MVVQEADGVSQSEGNRDGRDKLRVPNSSCGVVDPMRVEKLHVREPRDPVTARVVSGPEGERDER
jgi:hypothetical protein